MKNQDFLLVAHSRFRVTSKKALDLPQQSGALSKSNSRGFFEGPSGSATKKWPSREIDAAYCRPALDRAIQSLSDEGIEGVFEENIVLAGVLLASFSFEPRRHPIELVNNLEIESERLEACFGTIKTKKIFMFLTQQKFLHTANELIGRKSHLGGHLAFLGFLKQRSGVAVTGFLPIRKPQEGRISGG